MKRILTVLAIISIFLLSGCIPKGDPKQTLDTYYKDILSSNFSVAYDLLCDKNKKEITKDEFNQLQLLNNEASKCKGFKTTKKSEKTSDSKFGYQNVIEFEVTEEWHSYSENQDFSSTYKRYVVNDQGEWKVYNEGNYKTSLAKAYTELGWMYFKGKGKAQNINEAEKNLNNGLKVDPKDPYIHYLLGAVYNQQKRFAEAVDQEKIALETSKEDDVKTNALKEMEIAQQGKEKGGQ